MKNKKDWSIDEVQKIWQLASRLHDGQKYGGPEPEEKVEYINHIGSVAFEIMNALEHSTEMDARLALSCAILHDSIEDTPFTYEKVKKFFGTEIADGVLALTKNDQLESASEKMLDSLQRIKQQPKEVWAVKMADRITNLYAPPFYWKDEKKLLYLKEAEVILEHLKDGNEYLAKRLAIKIKEYQSFIQATK